ncbi:MAG: hypothetical protein HY854_03870 [Burkholderiales bacterium]|nr:hypothetical protein [Burkholderiales bacterium]
MQVETHAPVAFYLTGRAAGAGLDPMEGLGLRPALFAGYEDLTSLRYDFPVVLAGDGGVEPLSGLFDAALEVAAQGPEAARVRQHGLRLEREMRVLAALGERGRFGDVFEAAAARIGPAGGTDFADSQRRIRAALKCEGELADCDGLLARRLLQHLWQRSHEAKAAAFGAKLRRLKLRLAGILQAGVDHSRRGVTAGRLEASVGPAYAETFDFDAMSRLLARSLPVDSMPAGRRQRIAGLLRVLDTQRFFAQPDGAAKAAPYGFVFDTCAAALKAWRERQPRLVELARALVVAELEIAGTYDPARHDAVFRNWGGGGLDASELAAFPDYLVAVHESRLDANENARLMEILSAGLPIKVLLQADDLADDTTPGLRSRRLASLAMGLNTAYVLQSAASNLLRFGDRLRAAMAYRGPALVNVYSGAGSHNVPPYLVAAAAMESRAFPAFSYDPSAGADWAARFFVRGNPQPELDWPVRQLAYEDGAHQAATMEVPFTVIDFLAADARYASHFARVPRTAWDECIGVDEALAATQPGMAEKVPGVAMLDAADRLQKVIVDQALMRQAARCRDLWRSLQELGGIHNSHARDLLERDRQARREEDEARVPVARTEAPVAAVVTEAPAAAAQPAEPAGATEHAADEAYIETERCSSCNECTQINNRMFAYDSNQQAYIADITAGTYAQLVEAAESCQVAVIHPGKPRDPNEPGLADLLKRAELFA